MLSKLFEKPRYVVAAVGFTIQLQGVIFTLIEPTVFSKSLMVVGVLILAGGLHIELRSIATNELRIVCLFFARLKESRASRAEERSRQRLANAEIERIRELNDAISRPKSRTTERDSSAAWAICILLFFAAMSFSGKGKTSSSYSSSKGKPYDMPQKDWDYATKRLDQETNWNRKEAEEATRGVWKYEKLRRARD